MYDANSLSLLSVTLSLLLLAATALLGLIVAYLMCRRLLVVLSSLDRTLRLCALALHSIAGGNSTGESLERRVGE